MLEVPVYDGSETGEKVYNTLTVIGRAIAPDERVPTDAAAGKPALAGMKRWPVTVSYFDRAKTGGEQTPVYSIKFELYENGISRALVLDYNDFVDQRRTDHARDQGQQALSVAAWRTAPVAVPRGRRTSIIVFVRSSVEALDHRFVAEFLAQPVDRLLGFARCAGRAGRPGRRRRRRRAPRRRCRSGGSACRRSRARAGRGRRRRSLPRAGSDGSSECARVRMRKSAVLSLSVTVAPASSLALSRAETFSASRHSRSSSGRKSAMSRSKVVSAEMLLASRSGAHRRGRRCRARGERAAAPSAP